uniref:Preprotein translocase subunit A n=1 Tax=Phaeophyceae sp. TaxID=2249243 RepID=A0A8E5BDF1_9PHAE|nr:preprotein translocase subunit A [Phaeophyceae sp.]
MILLVQNKTLPTCKQRFLYTFSLLTLIRIGSFLTLPYLSLKHILSLNEVNSSITKIFRFLNNFSGGTKTSLNIFSLSILPYINASIIIQLLTTFNPNFRNLQKEEGEYGRRKLIDYTRYLTFICAIFESFLTIYSFRTMILNFNFSILIQLSLTLITGSMILLWFSELITKYGIGNGSSILICFNIVSNFPEQLKSMIFFLTAQKFFITFFITLIFILITFSCVYLNEAIIKLPVISAKQLFNKVNNFSLWNYSVLPLRINQAGVMPLVYTSSIMFFFSFIKKYFNLQINNLRIPFGIFLYWLLFGIFLYIFTVFYSKMLLNPKDIAENFIKNSTSIKGLTPGIQTKNYFSKISKRLIVLNTLFLITILIFLNSLEYLLPINNLKLNNFGFTSQLILVNILIDTFSKIRKI